MPGYIREATVKGDIKSVLRWISLDRTEDRANATSKTEMGGLSALQVAAMGVQPVLVALLLQLGADIDYRNSEGYTAINTVLFSSQSSTMGFGEGYK